METLNRNFSEYTNNAVVDDIEYIVSCCELFKRGSINVLLKRENPI